MEVHQFHSRPSGQGETGREPQRCADIRESADHAPTCADPRRRGIAFGSRELEGDYVSEVTGTHES